MLKSFLILPLMLSFLAVSGTGFTQESPGDDILHDWVQDMKQAPRGPFNRIRWFCNDGAVLPPEKYACKEHGGGVQHGELSDRALRLRERGFYIANIFADLNSPELLGDPGHLDIITQMILEQFLISADDGWIYRKARFYRGALQAEDEARGGEELLLAILADPDWRKYRYLLLREAARFIPHGRKGAPLTEMRQLSLDMAEKDSNFESLRIKIHVQPELADAAAVRTYAARQGLPALADNYEHLAETIEAVFQPMEIGDEITDLAGIVEDPVLARKIRQRVGQLSNDNDASIRFAAGCRLMANLREYLARAGRPRNMLHCLDVSLVLEYDLFRSGNELLFQLPQASRRQRIKWLRDSADGLFGTGLISERQRRLLKESFDQLAGSRPALMDYKSVLDYGVQVAGWSDRTLRFHFSEAIRKLQIIEPRTRNYSHDRLRGSLLLFYAAVMDSLVADANTLFGIRNRLFGQTIDTGLIGLNPGLARGTLMIARAGDDPKGYRSDGIYVLPATTEDLPPVSGIITAGKGNMLSHVQLLARNLGIPNVMVAKDLLPQISAMEEQKVVLAVSAKGIVHLEKDGAGWDTVFAREKKGANDLVIRPDLNKLDLGYRNFIPLSELRAADSGRICGPKAANLGELKHSFPESVTEGLVIPFGPYRALLDRPIEPGGISVFEWMQAQYAQIHALASSPQEQKLAAQIFLDRIRNWIVNSDVGHEFRERLRAAMLKEFGEDGTYGVFVRSDTNVEDLPGFTGAGLNLTVPNVVGFDNIMAAILRVWASPFSDRAYHWRQAYMESPEHVYASVLLMKSVPAEKSGVMVTVDVNNGSFDWLTIAVNEGVGGAVSGQTAEELRVNKQTGQVRLMAHATDPLKRILLDSGGVKKVAASGVEAVLTDEEIQLLIDFAQTVPERFPQMQDEQGRPVPADIEFGFAASRLVLFQIRPFLESKKARQNLYLNGLDKGLAQYKDVIVNLDERPAE